MKKMNQTEVKTVAKRILQEVNEINRVYNETVKNSQAYKDEVEKIRAKDPLAKLTQEVEKLFKLELGTDYEKSAIFKITSQGKNSELRIKLNEELHEFNKKSFKEIYDEKPSVLYYQNKIFDSIVDEITISQITISDVQLLINTIKAKLI